MGLPGGRIGGGFGSNVTISGPITIVTQATDARGIASALKTQLSRAL